MFTLLAKHEHGAASPIQLDPQEISVRKHRVEAQESEFRFRHHQNARQFWLRVLPHTCLSPSKQSRFAKCGTNAWVQFCPTSKEFRIASDRCKLRICPACAEQRARRVAAKLSQLQQRTDLPATKLLTLTLRPSKRDLPDQIAYLKSCFRRLRATAFWKKASPCGLAVVEVTRGEANDHWHVHLHAVMRSQFLNCRKLSVVWKRITCGSFIVQVKAVKVGQDLTNYLARYLAKIPDPSQISSYELADEWIRAVDRTHWLITFGQKPQPHEDEAKPTRQTWIHVCKLTDLLPYIGSNDWREAAATYLQQRLREAHERTNAHVIDST